MSAPVRTGPEVESVRLPLDAGLDPEQALLWLRGEERPFALIGEWLGVGALLGSHPLARARHGDPFEALDRQPWVGAGDGVDWPEAPGGGEAIVGGGWVGSLGYRLGTRIEQLPPGPPAPVPLPEHDLAFYDHVVVFDGERWWFECLWSQARSAALEHRYRTWQARLRTPPAPSPPDAGGPTPFALASDGAGGHLAAVAECRRRIGEGELFQANLCLRLEARFEGDPIDLFARALARGRPRFGALAGGVVSLSPERFLRRSGRMVQAEPIKGTRARGGGVEEQLAAFEELLSSSKDAAEHVMIVDLMRNDLGRVCSYGSIAVEPPRVEAHAGVWHLVSTVSGELREGIGHADLLRATFPPGSVTGAPKVQAMKVIAELEATRREVYTGAIGIASPLAGLDLNVAIRTFEMRAGRIWLGVGGGIVADSDPEAELEEALTKGAGVIEVIGGRLAPVTSAVPRRRAREGIEAALAHGSRPDPAEGVFETLLVRDRRPLELEAHLARLAGSVRELYGASLAEDLAELAQAAAARCETEARMRIHAASDGSAAITTAPLTAPAADGTLTLEPFSLPGGLGEHKWSDRRLLDALARQAKRAGAQAPLLVDAGGLVLEAAHANVWLVEAGELLTPPADGRILPGVVRARLLAGQTTAREEPITLERLEQADAIFLTSSIRGWHPARLSRT